MNIQPIRLLPLAIVLLTIACTSKKKQSTATQDGPVAVVISDSSMTLMGIRLAPVEQKVVQSFVYLNGKVVAPPNFRATISSDIEGKVKKIFVREGSTVQKGQPLLTLRSMQLIELQNQYAEATSENDFLAIEFNRQSELIKNNVGALADFQMTEAKYKATQSKVSALGAKLKVLGVDPSTPGTISNEVILRSPIQGQVLKLPVKIGMLAPTDMVLAEVINTDQLIADVYVYDNDLDDIHEGQTVAVDFINHMYPSVDGKVEHIARAFDPETKAVTAHVSFKAPEGRIILPDMSVRCVLVKQESRQPAPTVAVGAVLKEEDYEFVYVTYPVEKKGVENTLYKMRVTTASRNEHEVQIKFANPPAGEFLVVVANSMIVENERKKRSGMVLN